MHARRESQRPFCRVEALADRERAPGAASCLVHGQAISRATRRAHRSLHALRALSWLLRARNRFVRAPDATPTKRTTAQIPLARHRPVLLVEKVEGVVIVRDVSEVAAK